MNAKQLLVAIATSIAAAKAELETARYLSHTEGTDFIGEELDKAAEALDRAAAANMSCDRCYDKEG